MIRDWTECIPLGLALTYSMHVCTSSPPPTSLLLTAIVCQSHSLKSKNYGSRVMTMLIQLTAACNRIRCQQAQLHRRTRKHGQWTLEKPHNNRVRPPNYPSHAVLRIYRVPPYGHHFFALQTIWWRRWIMVAQMDKALVHLDKRIPLVAILLRLHNQAPPQPSWR